jgi:hypothetical protein
MPFLGDSIYRDTATDTLPIVGKGRFDTLVAGLTRYAKV